MFHKSPHAPILALLIQEGRLRLLARTSNLTLTFCAVFLTHCPPAEAGIVELACTTWVSWATSPSHIASLSVIRKDPRMIFIGVLHLFFFPLACLLSIYHPWRAWYSMIHVAAALTLLSCPHASGRALLRMLVRVLTAEVVTPSGKGRSWTPVATEIRSRVQWLAHPRIDCDNNRSGCAYPLDLWLRHLRLGRAR
ncbi:hypothetical protein BDZ97DRAFT_1296519 [Flammula alnicola]|nr:hypothetical protein BDZ97DRAFT_1296519 [Flammula alnicola]